MKLFRNSILIFIGLNLFILVSCNTTKDSIVYEYNDKGFPIKRTDPLGVCIYSYDKNGNLDTITLHDGRKWEYGYTLDGLVSTILDPYNGLTSYKYDKNGKVIRKILPDGTAIDNPAMPENPKVIITAETKTFNKPTVNNEVKQAFSKKDVFKYDDLGHCKKILK